MTWYLPTSWFEKITYQDEPAKRTSFYFYLGFDDVDYPAVACNIKINEKKLLLLTQSCDKSSFRSYRKSIEKIRQGRITQKYPDEVEKGTFFSNIIKGLKEWFYECNPQYCNCQ